MFDVPPRGWGFMSEPAYNDDSADDLRTGPVKERREANDSGQ